MATRGQIMKSVDEEQFLYGLYSNYAGPAELSRQELQQRREGLFEMLQAQIDEVLAHWQASGCNDLLGDDVPSELGAHATVQGAEAP
ncbi:MAG: hypothetical protein AAF371_04725 [Pseudomonadota bacterium]